MSKLLILFATLLLSIGARADGIMTGVSFTDKNTEESRTLMSLQGREIAPVGDFTVTVTAGLEQAVSLAVLDAEGIEVSTAESEPFNETHLVTESDSASQLQQTLTFPTPASDGEYTLVLTQSMNGEELASNTVTFTVDRQADEFNIVDVFTRKKAVGYKETYNAIGFTEIDGKKIVDVYSDVFIEVDKDFGRFSYLVANNITSLDEYYFKGDLRENGHLNHAQFATIDGKTYLRIAKVATNYLQDRLLVLFHCDEAGNESYREINMYSIGYIDRPLSSSSVNPVGIYHENFKSVGIEVENTGQIVNVDGFVSYDDERIFTDDSAYGLKRFSMDEELSTEIMKGGQEIVYSLPKDIYIVYDSSSESDIRVRLLEGIFGCDVEVVEGRYQEYPCNIGDQNILYENDDYVYFYYSDEYKESFGLALSDETGFMKGQYASIYSGDTEVNGVEYLVFDPAVSYYGGYDQGIVLPGFNKNLDSNISGFGKLSVYISSSSFSTSNAMLYFVNEDGVDVMENTSDYKAVIRTTIRQDKNYGEELMPVPMVVDGETVYVDSYDNECTILPGEISRCYALPDGAAWSRMYTGDSENIVTARLVAEADIYFSEDEFYTVTAYYSRMSGSHSINGMLQTVEYLGYEGKDGGVYLKYRVPNIDYFYDNYPVAYEDLMSGPGEDFYFGYGAENAKENLCFQDYHVGTRCVDRMRIVDYDMSSKDMIFFVDTKKGEEYLRLTSSHKLFSKNLNFPIFISEEYEVSTNIVNGNSVGSLSDIEATVSGDSIGSHTVSVTMTNTATGHSITAVGFETESGTFTFPNTTVMPGDYQMTLTSVDGNGQTATLEQTVSYTANDQPFNVNDDTDYIPGLAAVFTQNTDVVKNLSSQVIVKSDGTGSTGKHDIYAAQTSDGEIPVSINGISLSTTEYKVVAEDYDFDAHEGIMELLLKPEIDGVGAEEVTFFLMGANPVSAIAKVDFWQAVVDLDISNPSPTPVLEISTIEAAPGAGTYCDFTTDEQAAKDADAIKSPLCLFEWDALPDDYKIAEEGTSAKVQPTSSGDQSIAYSMYIYDAEGTKLQIGTGNDVLSVIAAEEAVTVGLTAESKEVVGLMGESTVSLEQKSGVECKLTLNEDEALEAAQAMSETPLCLVEWVSIPDEMSVDWTAEQPTLEGAMSIGEYTVTYDLSTYTAKGIKFPLGQQSDTFTAEPPPPPLLSFSSSYYYEDGDVYVVPMTKGSLGVVGMQGERSPMLLNVTRNGESIREETVKPMSTAFKLIRRQIKTATSTLWEPTEYELSLGYAVVPDEKTTMKLNVVASPDSSVKPYISVAAKSAMNIETFDVDVDILDRRYLDAGYDPDTMGVWDVRLVRQLQRGETEVLTDYVTTVDGHADFEIDLNGVTDSSVKLIAEARLQSPIEGYERVETTSRSTIITILRGEAIDAEVKGRKISGQAPFKGVFSVSLTDRDDRKALGDITWEISEDDGETWEALTYEKVTYSLRRTFDTGVYLIRAELTNKNSGRKKYTETIEVIAFDLPELEVDGPKTLLVGETGTYTATATFDGEELVGDAAVIEWSTDGGKTYTETGRSITLSREEYGRVKLWVRARTDIAPPGERYSYTHSRGSVDIKKHSTPRIRLEAPRLIETTKTYTVTASTTLPYRGMARGTVGYFTLPNGTEVYGSSADYVPTAADLESQYVYFTYTAWVDGYKETTSTSTSVRAKVWEYVWPEFEIKMKSSAVYAPADVAISVVPINFRGKLEEPVYTWTLPEPREMLDDRRETTKKFTVTEAGEHQIQLVVTDGRGNTRTVIKPLSLAEPPPYVIDLRLYEGNDYSREPLDVLVRSYISGGHPKDRVSGMTFKMDGEVIEDARNYARDTLDAGEHTLVMEIESKMGVTASQSATITVNENQPPECGFRISESVYAWVVYAECSDPDGRMSGYEWIMNGEEVSITSNRVTISKENGQPSLTLKGFDDSGAASEEVTVF